MDGGHRAAQIGGERSRPCTSSDSVPAVLLISLGAVVFLCFFLGVFCLANFGGDSIGSGGLRWDLCAVSRWEFGGRSTRR